MDLYDAHKEIVELVQEELLMVAAGYPIEKLGGVLNNLTSYFQALSICHLLESTDTNQFRENLTRSGYARRYFLRKSFEENNYKDRHLALSSNESLLDCLAAGQIRLACDIADLSLEKWNCNWEYEDDFCFYLYLHKVVKQSDNLPFSILEKIIERFENALEGGNSSRLEVCKSILMKDKDLFCNSLDALIEEKQESIEVEKERMLEPDPSVAVFWPRSYVFIEGLALLQLAHITGLRIKEEFPLCPTLGRVTISDEAFIDIFQEIEQELNKSK